MQSPSRFPKPALVILGPGRILVGICTLLAPVATFGAFDLHVASHATLSARMVGTRDVLLGAMVIAATRSLAKTVRREGGGGGGSGTSAVAPPKEQQQQSHAEVVAAKAETVRLALWGAIVSDVADFLVSAAMLMEGSVGMSGFVKITVGLAALIGFSADAMGKMH